MRVIFIHKLTLTSVIAGVMALVATSYSYAQDTAAEISAENPAPTTNTETPAPAPQQAKATKPAATNAPTEKKMVQAATINLQTTVTGNQEQPRVLYILPWQNPTTGDVDFESLDNEQKAVFGHVEREELRRELEAAGEIQ